MLARDVVTVPSHPILCDTITGQVNQTEQPNQTKPNHFAEIGSDAAVSLHQEQTAHASFPRPEPLFRRGSLEERGTGRTPTGQMVGDPRGGGE
jgi:hypothetical protein